MIFKVLPKPGQSRPDFWFFETHFFVYFGPVITSHQLKGIFYLSMENKLLVIIIYCNIRNPWVFILLQQGNGQARQSQGWVWESQSQFCENMWEISVFTFPKKSTENCILWNIKSVPQVLSLFLGWIVQMNSCLLRKIWFVHRPKVAKKWQL